MNWNPLQDSNFGSLPYLSRQDCLLASSAGLEDWATVNREPRWCEDLGTELGPGRIRVGGKQEAGVSVGGPTQGRGWEWPPALQTPIPGLVSEIAPAISLVQPQVALLG